MAAVAMAARSLQREAEDMLDYDVIHEKKTRKNPGRKTTRWSKRKMAPAVKSRAALVKKAFALREKTGSRMKPTTIMKDPAAAIRRLSK